MTSETHSVVLEGLTKRFGSFVAVDHVDLKVRRGEVFGFLGPNGAGKSTTIRMLCGLLRPSAGRATVAGYDVAHSPEQVRQRLGYMSQKFSLYADLTVMENIRLFAGLYSVPEKDKRERIAWALTMSNLNGRENLITGALPGGWKQRLALGCAVLHKPPILFLDEPTSGVDPIARRQFWTLIHQMADEGVTVFVTTHYMEEAEYCNRLALIDRGTVVALGSPSELKDKAVEGDLLLLECSHPGEALESLRRVPGVRDAAVFGNAIHLVVEDASTAEPAIRNALLRLSNEVSRLERIRPSLEDVFVALTASRRAAREQTT